MYQPAQFRSTDLQHALAIMRLRPLASLVSTDAQGFPMVTHLPLHAELRAGPGIATGASAEVAAGVDGALPLENQRVFSDGPPDEEPSLVLLGHCARANPHWRVLQSHPQALVTFMGPQAYLSPSVYPDLARVPSWNYLAVHCRVEARLLPDAADKDTLLKALIGQHEPAYAEQWRGLDENYTSKMLQAIAAFELHVVDWQCTVKLNQHRPESHAALHAAYCAGDDDARALAQWMQVLGLVPHKET